MFKINIITQLILFMIMALAINQFNLHALLVLLFLLIIILMLNNVHQFINTLKRFKWLFLVMMMIYTLNTPGEHIVAWSFNLKPTYEGVIAGVAQVIRVSVILAMISWVTAVNTKQQLVSGFYFILSPLRLFGLETERFAARLLLTLHYVEQASKPKLKESLMATLDNVLKLKLRDEQFQIDGSSHLENGHTHSDIIEFIMPKFHLVDFLAIVGFVLFLTQVIL